MYIKNSLSDMTKIDFSITENADIFFISENISWYQRFYILISENPFLIWKIDLFAWICDLKKPKIIWFKKIVTCITK